MDENMLNKDILYVPIQINGGETIPSELTNALERELYIRFDSQRNFDGMLYVGKKINDKTEYIPVMVDKALRAQTIGDIDYPFYLSTDNHEALRIAGFRVTEDGLKNYEFMDMILIIFPDLYFIMDDKLKYNVNLLSNILNKKEDLKLIEGKEKVDDQFWEELVLSKPNFVV